MDLSHLSQVPQRLVFGACSVKCVTVAGSMNYTYECLCGSDISYVLDMLLYEVVGPERCPSCFVTLDLEQIYTEAEGALVDTPECL